MTGRGEPSHRGSAHSSGAYVCHKSVQWEFLAPRLTADFPLPPGHRCRPVPSMAEKPAFACSHPKSKRESTVSLLSHPLAQQTKRSRMSQPPARLCRTYLTSHSQQPCQASYYCGSQGSEGLVPDHTAGHSAMSVGIWGCAGGPSPRRTHTWGPASMRTALSAASALMAWAGGTTACRRRALGPAPSPHAEEVPRGSTEPQLG